MEYNPGSFRQTSGIVLFPKPTLIDNFRGKKYIPFVFVIFTTKFLEYGIRQ